MHITCVSVPGSSESSAQPTLCPAWPCRQKPVVRAGTRRHAAFAITGLWMLAARSRHTLVHVPMRGNTPPDLPSTSVGVGELDLVLSHFDLQFAPNQWKHVRSRLGHWGAPHRFRVRRPVLPAQRGDEDSRVLDDPLRGGNTSARLCPPNSAPVPLSRERPRAAGAGCEGIRPLVPPQG